MVFQQREGRGGEGRGVEGRGGEGRGGEERGGEGRGGEGRGGEGRGGEGRGREGRGATFFEVLLTFSGVILRRNNVFIPDDVFCGVEWHLIEGF